MSMFDRSLAAVAVLLLYGCGDGQANADQAPVAAPVPAQEEVALQGDASGQDEATAKAWLRDKAQQPGLVERYDEALEAWTEKASACQIDQCRTTVQADRSAAAAFAAGRAARVQGLPFSGGVFGREEADFSGQLRIVPLTEGEAIVVIGLSFKDRPSCDLQGVMTPRQQGGWTVRSLETGLPEMVLTAKGADALSLSYAEAGHQPWQVDYCSTGVSIDGDYGRQQAVT